MKIGQLIISFIYIHAKLHPLWIILRMPSGFAKNKGTDQPAYMRRLSSAFGKYHSKFSVFYLASVDEETRWFVSCFVRSPEDRSCRIGDHKLIIEFLFLDYILLGQFVTNGLHLFKRAFYLIQNIFSKPYANILRFFSKWKYHILC